VSASATISEGGRTVRVTWPDGETHSASARWLFDHADDARDPISGQRSLGALALDGDARLSAVEIDGEALRLCFSPSGAQRRINLGALRGGDAPRALSCWLTPEPIARASPIPFEAYLSDDPALREALARVARFGIAVLSGAGAAPDAVERAVARFGYIRETNYGRCFDVKIEPRPGNLAYTELALDLHTDNPYRDPPPTLQLLHAIVNGEGGGETLFADAFAHAEALRRESPDAFEILVRTPVRFSFADASGARWSAVSPVLRLDATGVIEAVRLNHRSLDLAPGDPEEIDAWYEAYLAFYRRLHAPEAAYERRLRPGEMVIFDNRRLVHGRRALATHSRRWLRGCYADVDGLDATLTRLAGRAGCEAGNA
jgi:alpha-ketoglutarate-dependent taurine dioxygenase